MVAVKGHTTEYCTKCKKIMSALKRMKAKDVYHREIYTVHVSQLLFECEHFL